MEILNIIEQISTVLNIKRYYILNTITKQKQISI